MNNISHIYIHIPFCIKKCQYCDFASIVYNKDLVSAYLAALAEEIKLRCSGLSPETIYIGGGTPSSLADDELETLLRALSAIDQSALDEYTIEINPGTINVEKMLILKNYNINRISIGIQSFNNNTLSLLGRIHDARQAKAAYYMACEAGFENISIDIINSWPGQCIDMCLDDLQQAVKFGPSHISSYSLTYEPGTPLNAKRERGDIKPVGEDLEREIYDLTCSFLECEGYIHYEISSYCMGDKFSRHNIAYWLGKQYVGLGSSACSYVDYIRFTNNPDPQQYINRIIDSGTAKNWQECLTPEQRARERAVINLRLAEGINVDLFENETGFSFQEILNGNQRLVSDGWLEYLDGYVRLSKKAFPLADSVLMELI